MTIQLYTLCDSLYYYFLFQLKPSCICLRANTSNHYKVSDGAPIRMRLASKSPAYNRTEGNDRLCRFPLLHLAGPMICCRLSAGLARPRSAQLHIFFACFHTTRTVAYLPCSVCCKLPAACCHDTHTLQFYENETVNAVIGVVISTLAE